MVGYIFDYQVCTWHAVRDMLLMLPGQLVPPSGPKKTGTFYYSFFNDLCNSCYSLVWLQQYFTSGILKLGSMDLFDDKVAIFNSIVLMAIMECQEENYILIHPLNIL